MWPRSRSRRLPRWSGSPASDPSRSFTRIGTPRNGPSGGPASASARARSSRRWITALSCGVHRVDAGEGGVDQLARRGRRRRGRARPARWRRARRGRRSCAGRYCATASASRARPRPRACRRAARGSAAPAGRPRSSTRGTRPRPPARVRPTRGDRELRRRRRTATVARRSGARRALERGSRCVASMPEPTRPANCSAPVVRRVVVADEQRAEPALEPPGARAASRRPRAPGRGSASPCATRRPVAREVGAVDAAWRRRPRGRAARLVASTSRAAARTWSAGVCQRGPGERRGARAARAGRGRAARRWSGRRATARRTPCSTTGCSAARSCGRRPAVPACIRGCSRSKLGTPGSSRATISPSSRASTPSAVAESGAARGSARWRRCRPAR